MAKQGSKNSEEEKSVQPKKDGLKECEVLMTEMMQMLLKQHKDPALQ